MSSVANDKSASPIDAALAVHTRPPRPSALSTVLTFGWRALLKIKHVPMQLFDVTAFPAMMTLMFTFLFGGALAGSIEAYVQYLIPGILVMTIVMITMYTGMTVKNDIAKGIFDRFRSLPIWQPSAMVGALLGDLVRYTIAACMVLLLGFILGFKPQGGIVGVVLGVLLVLAFSFSLSWIWTMLGLLLKTTESVMGVSSMVLFPLTFASNIFVNPATMPSWLQVFVDHNPVTHMAAAARALMHAESNPTAILAVLIWSAALVAVFGTITMILYRKKGESS